MNENISWAKIVVLLVAIIGVGALGFVMGKQKSEVSVVAPIAPAVQPVKKEEAKPAEKAQPVEVPADDWRIYTDSRYQFVFEYPSVCKLNNGSGVGVIEGINLGGAVNSDQFSDDCNFTVEYWENLNDVVVSDVPSLRKSAYDLSTDSGLSKVKKTKFEGDDALIAVLENETGSLQERVIYIQHNGHIYRISYGLRNLDHVFNGDVPEKIISTFKFTE